MASRNIAKNRRRRRLLFLVAGALAVHGRADVRLSFQSIGLPGFASSEPQHHSLTVAQGSHFEFDVWISTDGAGADKEFLMGFSLILRDYSFSAGDTHWLWLTANLERNPVGYLASPLTMVSGPDLLPKQNPGDPGQGLAGPLGLNGRYVSGSWESTDLGAFYAYAPGDSIESPATIYLGRARLFVESEMPLGSRVIGPGGSTGWNGQTGTLVPDDPPVFHTLDGSGYYVPFTINVIPEPSEYAMAGSLALLGFGLWRRCKAAQV